MALFDQYAADYDSWYQDKKGGFMDSLETDLLFRLFKAEKGMHVLDFGCGTGNFSLKLAQKGCRVTGVDISDEMLKIARGKATGNHDIEFLKFDGNRLPFADNLFDAAVSMAVFEFMREPLVILEELFRVVKKGGQVAVGTIAGNSTWGKFYLSESIKSDSPFSRAYFKTLEEMKSWDKARLVETGESVFIPPTSTDDEFNIEHENRLAGKTKGGFICALWRK